MPHLVGQNLLNSELLQPIDLLPGLVVLFFNNDLLLLQSRELASMMPL